VSLTPTLTLPTLRFAGGEGDCSLPPGERSEPSVGRAGVGALPREPK
jgi:hypothetical protein